MKEKTLAVRPEAAGLLACVRGEFNEAERKRSRDSSAAANFDWDCFYRLARRHSVVPLVSHQLLSLKDSIPPDVLQRFQQEYRENAARNVVLANELTLLTDALAEAGIDAIAFKGPALAVSAYGDLNLRRFVDLDLIVRRADMPRAIEILQQRGYQAAKSLDEKQQSLLLRTQHNLQFSRGRLIVELHWQVASELFASSVTAEDLWQNLSTVEINGKKVRTLATDDLLFALCVHGSRHLWQRLAWICDIDRIIRAHPDIDWKLLLKRARKAKAERMFLLGIALSRALLGSELPIILNEAIARDGRIASLVAETRTRLFEGVEQQPLSAATTIRFNLLVRRDWHSRFRYCRFLLSPTDSDLQMVRLSPALHFFYYLLRLWRLLRPAAPNKSGAQGSLAN